MNTIQLLEIARKENPEYSGVELVELINSTIIDICNQAEPFLDEHEFTTNGSDQFFEYNDFPEEFNERFMKPREVKSQTGPIRPINNSVDGDTVVEFGNGGFTLAFRSGGQLNALPDGKPFALVYYAYPKRLTIESTKIPMPQAHSLFLWRLKADMYAEKRHWDRAGYYNRRYNNGLLQYKRMVNSSGIQRIVHPNSTL